MVSSRAGPGLAGWLDPLSSWPGDGLAGIGGLGDTHAHTHIHTHTHSHTLRSHRARTELTNAYCLATVPCKYNCNFIIGNSLRVHQRELRDGRRRALNIPRALVLALALALALASA